MNSLNEVSTTELAPLSDAFYAQSTVEIARKLLGAYLLHTSSDGVTAGRIVETEAYLGFEDPASHAYAGKTARNAVMFGEAGRAYIYFIYGVHYCLNVTTMPAGIGQAVLLRALEPVAGIDLMRSRRKVERLQDLCNGPAKLVTAMGITPRFSGHDLREPPLTVCSGPPVAGMEIRATPRIGISKAADLPLRFHIAGNRFVSGRRGPTV
jgi:DNA-3-methyladenine glycosylase